LEDGVVARRATLTGPWLAALVALAGCAQVLGFEDHKPFPSDDGGSAGASSVSSGGSGGAGGSAGGSGGAGVAILLIPDRGEDSIGIYSTVDGTYLGDFVPPLTGNEPYSFSSANNAAQGPDGRIYISDQLTDSIVCFEADGTFHSVLADTSDGLDNLRGIDFRDQEVFVSVSPAATAFVARFDLTGNRLADFVSDTSDPFDVLFLANGTMMLANIATPDDVRLYDVDATSFVSLLPSDFPQQIQTLPNGNFLVAAWTEVTEFQIDGTVVRTLPTDIGRGVYPLEDGQWLISSDSGVQAVNPFSQQVVQQVRVGTSFSKIERAVIPSLP
jgi:hypothetical protein